MLKLFSENQVTIIQQNSYSNEGYNDDAYYSSNNQGNRGNENKENLHFLKG